MLILWWTSIQFNCVESSLSVVNTFPSDTFQGSSYLPNIPCIFKEITTQHSPPFLSQSNPRRQPGEQHKAVCQSQPQSACSPAALHL